jgi:valyl-tRNA synthetase
MYPENTQKLVKTAYNEHFNYLQKIVKEVKALDSLANESTDERISALLRSHLANMKKDIVEYSANLKSRGVEIFHKAG